MIHEFIYQVKDKINLKFETSDDLNFYEIGPWIPTNGMECTQGTYLSCVNSTAF